MDPRRLLIVTALGLGLTGCAVLGGRPSAEPSLGPAEGPAPTLAEAPGADRPSTVDSAETTARIPPPAASQTERPYLSLVERDPSAPVADPDGTAPASREARARPGRTASGAGFAPGPAAIAAANASARARSQADQFVGGVQVFAWDPGRIYEVWTAPLRVTTLTLAPGETVLSKAAGDTVRWQIGETASGEGPSRRAHVMVKPLERGLETNLVLATSRRVYLLQLRSGAPEGFNAAIAWDLASVFGSGAETVGPDANPPAALVEPAGRLDARFRIEPRGRRPAWTPTSVVTDGRRTFLHFPPALAVGEAPALFVLGPDGRPHTVNYRQQDGLWVVDQVLDRAELRLGERRPRIVRITRLAP